MMSGDVKKIRKDKEIVVEMESQIREINQQFVDQLKSLDQRLDIHLNMVSELKEYYRSYAEVQIEHAKSLEKISKQINTKDNKLRRESWTGYSTFKAWHGLVSSTKQSGREHAGLVEVLNVLVVNRLVEIYEDIQRIYKKCRDVTLLCQGDISKVLSELLNAMKTYHQYHGESQAAESKLLRVQSQKVKVDQQSSITKKFVNYEKKSEKKQAKYTENKLKALKARNEYLLCLDIANAAIRKYFDDDFPNLVKKMDAGYHGMMSGVLEVHATAQQILSERDQTRVAQLWEKARAVKGSSDYENFFASCHKVFVSPNKIEFQSHKGDEITQISAQKAVQDDIIVRLDQINMRINKEKEEKIEMSKSLEANEKLFFEKLTGGSVNVEQYFSNEKTPTTTRSPTEKSKEDKIKLEDSFLEMYKVNLLRDNLIVRLQTKYDSLRKALGENVSEQMPFNYSHKDFLKKRPPSLPPKPKKKIKDGRSSKDVAKRPQLFGGSIEEYVEATGEAIPTVMRSCIRTINLYGMHLQGIFRVSASVCEMANFKAQFEKGEDPFADNLACDDVNTVAGLLKLYFRELKEPLFPFNQFDNLIKCCEANYSNDGDKGWKDMLQKIILSLSPQRIVIMRYLFAFLSHVTEYSDENMMEAYNLSICFGPTLVIPPKERTDEHQYQGLINDLIKNIIINHEDIFPPPTPKDEDDSAVYEKYFTDDKDLQECQSDDGLKGTVNEEDEEYEEQEAIVDEDYQAQNENELTCRKGDVVFVIGRLNNNWWKVELQNKIGLLPDRVFNFPKRMSFKKSHAFNKSTECLITVDFNNSQSSLSGSSSSQAVSDVNIRTFLPGSGLKPSESNKLRSSNISLQNANKVTTTDFSKDISSGFDNVLAKVQSDLNSLDAFQNQQPSTRYQQILVPVLPPLPRSPQNADMQSQKPPLVSSSKARNASASSDLDVVVAPPSPVEEMSFPAPPPLSRDLLVGKLSNPIPDQKGPPGGIFKWNSLPHNIPASGSNMLSASIPTTVPGKLPSTSTASAVNSSAAAVGLSSQSTHGTPTTIQSATLPRQSDKQSSAPPVIRSKPNVQKKRISIEDKPVVTSYQVPEPQPKPVVTSYQAPVAQPKPTVTSFPAPVAQPKPTVTSYQAPVAQPKPVVTSFPAPEAQPKPAVTTHQPNVSPYTSSGVSTASTTTSSTTQVSKDSSAAVDNLSPGSTFLASLETRSSSGERNQFSSFKISSNAQKK